VGAVEAERHVNWFALEKAAERPGCPVCTIVVDRSRRYIDNMLFEHVSDRGFRAAYRASLGFCREHARDLESFRDGLAVAILGSDALCEYLSFLERGKSARARGRCPACAETERVEREFLSFILSTSDPEFVASSRSRRVSASRITRGPSQSAAPGLAPRLPARPLPLARVAGARVHRALGVGPAGGLRPPQRRG
jgi:hypothetical protein